mmetsp:Transcript_9396/g.17137  ORF Transcript_9396/g.17137 Transcript_9396/m.17137 type:complete len:245 (-) Transcript_9396:48-782(-)
MESKDPDNNGQPAVGESEQPQNVGDGASMAEIVAQQVQGSILTTLLTKIETQTQALGSMMKFIKQTEARTSRAEELISLPKNGRIRMLVQWLNATEVLVESGLTLKDVSHALKSALKQADNELADKSRLDHAGYQKIAIFTMRALTKLDSKKAESVREQIESVRFCEHAKKQNYRKRNYSSGPNYDPPARKSSASMSMCRAAPHCTLRKIHAETNCYVIHPEMAPEDQRARHQRQHAEWVASIR